MLKINKEQFLKLNNVDKVRVLKNIIKGEIKYKGE